MPSAPAVTLTAIGSGRTVNVGRFGVTALLTFCGPGSQHAVAPILKAVRRPYPSPGELLCANLVDLHIVPGLLRKIPEAMMEQRYREAVAELSPGRDPFEEIVILPDWDGATTRAFGFADTGSAVALAVTSAQGTVLGAYQGADPAHAALELLGAVLGRGRE